MNIVKPYLVIYFLNNGHFSKIINSETQEKAQEAFENDNPGAEILSIQPYGTAF